MTAKQRAYRLLWRARDIAHDDITQFLLVGRIAGAMGAIWEEFSAAERNEVYAAGPARTEEVTDEREQPEPQQAPAAGGGPAHETDATGARGEPGPSDSAEAGPPGSNSEL